MKEAILVGQGHLLKAAQPCHVVHCYIYDTRVQMDYNCSAERIDILFALSYLFRFLSSGTFSRPHTAQPCDNAH